MRHYLILAVSLTMAANAMTIDVDSLWNHAKPAESEQRFLAALETASADDRLILQTQVARTYGIRGNFTRAREILGAIEPQVTAASPEAQVRYWLELGRTYASATHKAADRTAESNATAKRHFLHAFELAERTKLDDLAVDALHMMPIVDTKPEEQLAWNERAMDYVERSTQAKAKRWEASLRNNIGYALHLKGDYEGALREFRLSRAAHERAGKVHNVRIADWMIAWTLRAQHKIDEAIAMQLALEKAWEADNEPDPYVYEELEHLYRAKGDEERAAHYAAKLKASKS